MLLVGLGTLPARAAAPISLQLPTQQRLLDQRLTFLGSGGDAAAPMIHPVLGEAGAGLVAGLITVPLMLLTGVAMQNDSPDFLVAGLPPILLFIAVPAVGVSFAEWGAGRYLGAEVHVQPAVYVALGVQLLAFLGGFAGGVGPKNFASMAIFSVVDAIVLSGAVLGTMNLQLALSAPPKATFNEPVLPPSTAFAGRATAFTSSTASGVSLFAGAF